MRPGYERFEEAADMARKWCAGSTETVYVFYDARSSCYYCSSFVTRQGPQARLQAVYCNGYEKERE